MASVTAFCLVSLNLSSLTLFGQCGGGRLGVGQSKPSQTINLMWGLKTDGSKGSWQRSKKINMRVCSDRAEREECRVLLSFLCGV